MRADNSPVNCGTASGHELARSKVTQGVPDDGLFVAPFSVVASHAARTGWAEKVLSRDEGNILPGLSDAGLLPLYVGLFACT